MFVNPNPHNQNNPEKGDENKRYLYTPWIWSIVIKTLWCWHRNRHLDQQRRIRSDINPCQSISQFSHSVVSNSLQPHELEHARPPCPSPTPGFYSNWRPRSQWCHPAISSSVPLLLLPPSPPSIRVFSNESALLMRWPMYLWSINLWQRKQEYITGKI